MDSGVSSKPRTSFEFEVQEILDVSSDGNYQVQWAPAWVSKFHLVGCENLTQEFLQRQQTGRRIKVEPITMSHHKEDMKISSLTQFGRLSGKEYDKNVDAVQQPQTNEENSTNPLLCHMQGIGNSTACLEKDLESSWININDCGLNDATCFAKTVCPVNSSLSCGKPVMDDLHDHCTSSIIRKTDSPLVPVKDVSSQQHSDTQSANEQQNIDKVPLNICDVTYWSSLSAVPCVAQINLLQSPTIQHDIRANLASNTIDKDVSPLTYVLNPDTQVDHPPIDFATTGFEQSFVPMNNTVPCNKQDNSGNHDPSSHVNHKANRPLVPVLDECSQQHFGPQSTNEQQETCNKGPLNCSKNGECSPFSTVTSFEQPDQSQSILHGASIQQGCLGESASNISEKDNKTDANHKILEGHSQNPTSQLEFDDQHNAVAGATGKSSDLSLKRIGKKLPLTNKRQFECSNCSKKFVSKSSLCLHTRIHTGERPYKCGLCDYKCARKAHLASHMHVHTNTRPHKEKNFECSQCPKKFISQASLLIHKRTHSGDRPYKCELCDYTAVQKGNLDSHMHVHTGKKPHTCSYCRKSFSQKQNLKTHMRIHTGHRPYVCQVCEKSFIQLSSLNYHCSHVHRAEKGAKRGKENLEEDVESSLISTVDPDFNDGTTGFEQSFSAMNNFLSCNKQVNSGSHAPSSNVNRIANSRLVPVLDELSRQHISPQSTNEQQETCDKSLVNFIESADSSALSTVTSVEQPDQSQSHSTLHGTSVQQGILSESASIITEKDVVPSKTKVDLNIQEEHPPNPTFQLEFDDQRNTVAGATGNSTDLSLRRSGKSASNNTRRFECSHCSKNFTSQTSLLIHSRIHTGDRPYKCELCDYTCVQKGHLTSHMHVHTGTRPHSCSDCGKSFSHKQNLKTHMRIHTGHRPYVCKVCEKSFVQLSALKSHRNNVHRADENPNREKEI